MCIEGYNFSEKVGGVCLFMYKIPLDGNGVNWQQWLSLGELEIGEDNFLLCIWNHMNVLSIQNVNETDIKETVFNYPCFLKFPWVQGHLAYLLKITDSRHTRGGRGIDGCILQANLVILEFK